MDRALWAFIEVEPEVPARASLVTDPHRHHVLLDRKHSRLKVGSSGSQHVLQSRVPAPSSPFRRQIPPFWLPTLLHMVLLHPTLVAAALPMMIPLRPRRPAVVQTMMVSAQKTTRAAA